MGVAFGGQQVLLANGARMIVPLSAFASTLGFCRLATGLGMASGPILAAYSYDMTGGYLLSIILITVIAVVHFGGFSAALYTGDAPNGLGRLSTLIASPPRDLPQ